MARHSERIIIPLLILSNFLYSSAHVIPAARPMPIPSAPPISACTGNSCGRPGAVKMGPAVVNPGISPYRPYPPSPYGGFRMGHGAAMPLAALANAVNPAVPSAPPIPMAPVERIPFGKIVTPRDRIDVELNDQQFIMLSKDLNLVKIFNEQMKSGRDTGRMRDAINTLHSRFVFPIYNSFAHAATMIPSVDAAMQKVKDDLRISFGMIQDIGIIEGRKRKEFWVYDIFLFRAILELYHRMFDAAYRHNHFLINQTNTVCETCAGGVTTGQDAGAGNIGAPGGFCPDTTECKFKLDLDAQKAMNEENFVFLKEFMHSNQVNLLFGDDVLTWDIKFLGEYIPMKFDVRIVDMFAQAMMSQFPYMNPHFGSPYAAPMSPYYNPTHLAMPVPMSPMHMGMGMQMPTMHTHPMSQMSPYHYGQPPQFNNFYPTNMYQPYPNMMAGLNGGVMNAGHFNGVANFHQQNALGQCVNGVMTFQGRTINC